MAEVRFLRWRGKKNTESGLTILEIFLATILTSVLVAGMVTVRRVKAKQGPIRECSERQWHWMKAAQEIEWKVRRWEMFAGPCLRVGVLPVTVAEKTGLIELWDMDSARPLVRKMQANSYLRVPAQHLFRFGQQIVVCGEYGYMRGMVSKIQQGTGDVSLLVVDFDEELGERNIDELFPVGSMVASVRPITYQLMPSERPPEKILYERRSKTERRPVSSRMESLTLVSEADEDEQGTKVSMRFALGECQFERNFHMYGTSPLRGGDVWYLRGNELVVESSIPRVEEEE